MQRSYSCDELGECYPTSRNTRNLPDQQRRFPNHVQQQISDSDTLFSSTEFNRSALHDLLASRPLQAQRRVQSAPRPGYFTGSMDSESNSSSSSSTFTHSYSSSVWHDSIVKRFSPQGSSWMAGTLIMANVAIGFGILNFPRAYADAGGLIPGLTMQLVMFGIVLISLYQLGYSSRFYGSTNYQDMVSTHCGPIMANVCRLFMCLHIMGICVVMIVVFGDQLERFLLLIFGDDTLKSAWFTQRWACVPLVCFLTIFPLSCLRNFQLFAYTSFLGLICVIYITFGVVIRGYFMDQPVGNPLTNENLIYFDGQIFWNEAGFVNFLPLLTFAYEGHTEVPIMQACLEKRQLNYFMRVAVAYCSIAFVLYGLCGSFGYLTFGGAVNADVLLSYGRVNIYVDVAAALLIIKVITTMPLYVFCLRTVVDDLWRVYISPRLAHNSILNSLALRRYMQSFLLCSVIVAISIGIPNLTSAISLIGGLSAIFAFIYPGTCYFLSQLTKPMEDRKAGRIGAGIILIVWGTFLFGCIVSIALRDFIRSKYVL